MAFKDISTEESYKIIVENKSNDRFMVIDVRTPMEFNMEYIEDSVLLDIHSPDFKIKLEKLDKKKRYLIYCRTGARSGFALNMMKEMGFEEAYNMEGGILDWMDAGYPVKN